VIDDRLEDVLQWLDEQSKPFFQALLTNDHSAAATALKRIGPESKQQDFDESQQAIVRDRMRYMEYHLYRDAAKPKVAAGMLKDLLREFSRPVEDPLVAALRRTYVLQLRIIDERDGGKSYPPRELHATVADLPPDVRANEVEYHLAVWAFRHDEPELIEQALRHFTCRPGQLYGDFIWQHVNLMHQLNKGSATCRDVEEIVRRIEHPRMWKTVEATVWPECVKRGLVDGKVAGMLAERLNGFDIKYPAAKSGGS
jgi:hypothetical protein